MKQKLLLALLALFTVGGSNLFAQEDITSQYLTNADLSTVDNGWTYYSDAFKYTDWKTDGDVPVVEFYSQWNAGASVSITQKDFKFAQTITLPAGDYRIAVNAFYRNGAGDGTNPDKAWIFAGEKKQNVAALTSAGVASYTGSNDLYKAANAFSLGDFSNAFDFSLEEETEITLGFQGFFNTSLSWCILGPVKLYKYSLEDYLVDYRAKVAEAEALYDKKMNAEVLQALKDAVVQESTFTLSSQITEAIAALTTKINEANTSVSIYSNINTAISNYNDKANALDDNGKSAYQTSVSAIQTKYDNGTYKTLEDAENELSAAFINAIKAQTTENSSWTDLIKNPSFESGFDGWNNQGMAIQTNNSFAKEGSAYVEKWEPNGTFGVSQTISAMPAGVYCLTAHAKARGVTSARIYAADVNNAITIADSDKDYRVEFACDANADITIGFEGTGTGAGNSWLCVDNFRLTLISAGLPDVTAATGKMNAEVAAAQTTAIETYNANRTVANYNAAIAAIANAEASIAAYVPFTNAINKIDAALTAATTATASAEAYNTIKSAYNDGSIADADIMTKVAEAYNVVIPVIKSQTAAQADFTLAIQNQSFEYGNMTGWTAASSSDTGVRETSNATYATTGSDGKYLFNTWWQGVPLTQAVADLPNGEYTLTVSVASDGGTIYLLANGEHNEGIETYATTNAEQGQYSKDTFQDATFTFLVKDGNATIGVVGGADGTAGEHKDYVEAGYWWYKADNFRLVKNRDLTEEELAVVPTGITLDKTEVTLTATENTVTLTPTFDPENAMTTVTWASSDENVATVADGVVTAVSSGTATITVKSTLDENVSASATVTVSFPETEVPEYTNDGATRYVHHYGENIIKNGTFQYPNPFQGWKSGANGNCDANNYNIITDGDNKYIQAKASQGAGDSHSISTGWPIEAGKTYVFGYKVKASKAGTMQYLVTSLTNAIGTETAQLDTENERKAKPVTTSWTDVKYEFTNSYNYAFVQFRARWMADSQSFDDFYLVEKTADDDVIGNVQYALDAIPTANIGTGAFQYSQDAIDAANALVQGEATVEDVEAAYEALTTLNSPAEGQLYNIVVAEESNAKNGNALIIVPGATSANNPTGYGLNVTLAPNANLNQAVTFTKVSGNNYNISFETAKGTAYLTTGSLNGSAAGWKTQQIQATTDTEKKCAFTIVASTENNVFYIYNPEHKDYIDYQDGGALYTDTNIDHKAFSLVETSKPSITINTSAAGWGTTILPFAVAEIPEGVKVYSCAGVNGTALNLEQVDALEANKPYIIEGAWDEKLTGDAQGTALSYTVGLLTGTYERIAAPNGSYVLQKHDDKVAFFQVDTSIAQPNVPANRAYLQVESEAKMFTFGGDATAISALDALLNGDAEIFNVSGVKQNSLQKGMNIIKMSDGTTRKVIVK